MRFPFLPAGILLCLVGCSPYVTRYFPSPEKYYVVNDVLVLKEAEADTSDPKSTIAVLIRGDSVSVLGMRMLHTTYEYEDYEESYVVKHNDRLAYVGKYSIVSTEQYQKLFGKQPTSDSTRPGTTTGGKRR